MSLRGSLVVLALCGIVSLPAAAHAAATLVPDHTFRLGSCGGPQGPACDWDCGHGKTCNTGGQCALQGGAAFSAVLVAKADASLCTFGDPGSIMTIGLAGTPTGLPFQLTDTAFDLCTRDIACAGREARACNVCNDSVPKDQSCLSDDGQGAFPCPPGSVVFFCKDPCAGVDGIFTEDTLNIMSAWFSETRQPIPELIRAGLPSAPTVGRPVIYFAQNQLFPTGTPPATRICVRAFYTSQNKALGVCAGDATRRCATASDCAKGDVCDDGSPPAINPTTGTDVTSHSVCSGGFRAGRPCAGDGDCGTGSCVSLGASASTKFCSGSLGSCIDNTSCPVSETCISCPEPACGDAVLDPDEECDDGDTSSGDGCDSTCHLEPCFDCDPELGEQTLCFASSAGTPCDSDGTPCTAGQCNGSGACVDGGLLAGCDLATPEKAGLKIKRDPLKPQKAKLAWKWTGNAAFATSQLGHPAAEDDLTLCIYDQTGFRFDLTAPAGGTCAGKPCWKVETDKVKYTDKDLTPDGIAQLKAKSGVAGKGKLGVTAKGLNLVTSLPLEPPVRALTVRANGPACFESTFSAPKTNDAEQFKAQGD
jgi:cysteine-rich repeat protein